MAKQEFPIIKLAIQGDQDAFYQLILTHKAQLYRMAYQMLQNEQRALEAIQETTYRAYKSIARLENPAYFQTWLIRIMLNYCNDQLKKMNREKIADAHQLEQIISEPESFNDQTVHRLDLKQAISFLEPHIQQVIILKYFEDLTLQEISDVLEHPVGTIKTWLYKGLKMLRIKLDHEEGGREQYASS